MNDPVLTICILGCGSSGGVPRIGNFWGTCDPNEPKNRRMRSSILVSRGETDAQTNILVDTSPDMREQLLRSNCSHLDAVLYTHDHADQCHGLDDLRQIAYANKSRVPVYMNAATRATLHERFRYAFVQAEGSSYPAILDDHEMPERNTWNTIMGKGGDIPFMPFEVSHGPTFKALGFRFGKMAYTPDVSHIPEYSVSALYELDLWVIDALRQTPHPTHFSLDTALEWIDRMKPKQAVLTNMHVDMDYRTLLRELPEGVVPAYDGMRITASL